MNREDVLRSSGTTRHLAVALRALGQAARAHNAIVKAYNHRARERAAALLATSSRYRVHDGDPASATVLDAISTNELVEILVEHHGWRRFAAQLSLAIEMEIAAVPLHVNDLEPGLALELFYRVLGRGET